MADNLPSGSGTGPPVSTEEITTLNGVTVVAQHIQRASIALRTTDGVAVDVTKAVPFPIETNDITATGTITAINGSVVIALNGQSAAALFLSGTWVATLQFEGSLDGTTYFAVNGVYAGTAMPGTTTTANGLVRLTPASLAFLRVTAPAFTSGTVNVSWRASAATGGTFLNQSLTAGANVIGKVGIDQTTPGTTNLVALTAETVKVIGTVNMAAAQTIAVTQATAANLNATVTNLALTKGTQGATGVSTQDLKDAGRVIFSASTVIAGVTAVTAEALLSMVPTRDGVAAAGATSFAVTPGKRFRVTGISVGFISSAAAVLSMRFALRMNPSGAVTAASPILRILPVPSGAALAQAGGYADIKFIDGIEFSGTQQFGIAQIGSAATGTCWVSVSGFEY